MSYKLYVETENCFNVCVGDFEDYDDAQSQMESMIKDLLASAKKSRSGAWVAFKEQFPDSIYQTLNSYEAIGCAYNQEDFDIWTEEVSYEVSDNLFHLETDNEALRYNYTLATNTLGMDGSEEEYYFTLQMRNHATCVLERNDTLTIRLMDDDQEEEDEYEGESGDAIVFNTPDDILAKLEPVDLEEEDD